MGTPDRQIRASYKQDSITVYQAYQPEIATPAIRNGRFSSGFNRNRMTWIKPSFLWMMYRSGWATKPGQVSILAIDISRDGFEWALANSTLSHFDSDMYASRESWKTSLSAPVRIQWDPERDISMNKLAYRSLQVGLSGEAVGRYCDAWIVNIEDKTSLAHQINYLIRDGKRNHAAELLPTEKVYPVSGEVASRIGITQPVQADGQENF
ncbi:DUF4291 domain-containing protein [Nocardia sp. MW-W600-9]